MNARPQSVAWLPPNDASSSATPSRSGPLWGPFREYRLKRRPPAIFFDFFRPVGGFEPDSRCSGPDSGLVSERTNAFCPNGWARRLEATTTVGRRLVEWALLPVRIGGFKLEDGQECPSYEHNFILVPTYSHSAPLGAG